MAVFADFLPYILSGIVWTLGLVAGGLSIGFVIGLFMAIGQIYGGEEIQAVIHGYVWFFRSIPLLVLLFLFYFGLFPASGYKLDPLACSIVVLGLRSGAYQSQIFRGAIISLGDTQLQAARALGMSRLRGIFHIILPQALRISLPGWSNEYATMIKDSSLTFALGVLEILTRTRYVAMATHEPLLPYFFAGGLFIVLTYGGTKIVNILYERTKIPGLVGKL
ncbi:MAG TPA: amino acid ABC transporter permease [Terriglobales bacterium]|nr:amino acid ABC transporter permease [Terriglobales bacterium]